MAATVVPAYPWLMNSGRDAARIAAFVCRAACALLGEEYARLLTAGSMRTSLAIDPKNIRMKREEAPMYAFTQDVPITDAVYAGIVEKLAAGPMPGLVAHMCVRREDGGLRYIDVWESQAACDATFEEYVHPAV